MNRLSIIAVLLVGLVFVYASLELPATGDPTSAPATHVSPRYIEDAYAETHTPNLVTAVLADYRGYDTLGETVVIFTAGMGALLILGTLGQGGQPGGGGRTEPGGRGEEGDSE